MQAGALYKEMHISRHTISVYMRMVKTAPTPKAWVDSGAEQKSGGPCAQVRQQQPGQGLPARDQGSQPEAAQAGAQGK